MYKKCADFGDDDDDDEGCCKGIYISCQSFKIDGQWFVWFDFVLYDEYIVI